MPYGILKCDNITFDQGGADQNVTVSGIYRAITSGVTVTGTISGVTIIGTTTVSGATVTGTTVQGTTVQGVSGTFTSLTGTTTTGTTANFASGVFTTRVSGTTITGTTAQFTSGTFISLTGTTITGTTISGTTVSSTTGTFTSITGTTITGTTVNGTTVNSITGNFTSLTGITVTGTTANFTSGVFTTQVSGLTVTGTQSSFTSGNFVTLSGATATFTSGVIASGTAAAPSLSIIADPNTGLYSPGADQVALATAGTERMRIDNTGNVVISTGTLTLGPVGGEGGQLNIQNTTNTTSVCILDASTDTNARLFTNTNNCALQIGQLVGTGGNVQLWTGASERARIDSSGRLLVGTSSSFNLGGQDHRVQIESAGHSLSAYRWGGATTDAPAVVNIGRSRGTTMNSVTAVANNDHLGLIGFTGANGTDASNYAAWIHCYVDGEPFTSGDTTDLPGRLVFSTTADGTSAPTERMRIDSAGRVGVGTASPGAPIHSSKGGTLPTANGTETGIFQWSTATGNTSSVAIVAGSAASSELYFGDGDDIDVGYIKYEHPNNAFVFGTNTQERARIDSSGRLLVGTSTAAAGSTQTASIFGSTLIQSTGLQSLSSSATLDLNLLGNGVTGHLYVTSTLTSNAAIRTGETFFISTRLGDSTTITSLNSDNGSGGGRTFTITNPSGNIFRFTDTSASACTVSMSFVGAICA